MAPPAAGTATVPRNVIGQALVDFSIDRLFPEEDVSSAHITPEVLPEAIKTLAAAKAKLEGEIHSIIEETRDDVQAWIANAKALQSDIARRKTLASEILVRADAPETTGQSIEEAEAHARFLTNELNYNLQVRYLLEAIRSVSQLLDQVEQAAGERRILDALRMLEKTWTALDAMPVSKSCRVMRLLDIRAFELKSDVHEVFDRVWGTLVHVDAEQGTLTVRETRDDEPMSLSDAVIGLKAYKEVDDRMTQLWHELDAAVISPRTDLTQATRPAIYVDETVLGTRGKAEDGVEALFTDLEHMFAFLAKRLPADLVASISSVMMPDLVARITDVWLASAVPTSLGEMAAFEDTIVAAQGFCDRLAELEYSGFDKLQEWVENAPRVWLSKRREAALDAVRAKISQGLGTPQEVERIEKQMVSRSEGKELAANGPSAAAADQATDWDTAWSDEESETQQNRNGKTLSSAAAKSKTDVAEDDGADEWGAWGDDEQGGEADRAEDEDKNTDTEMTDADEAPSKQHDAEDDAADAWGWGEEDDTQQEQEQPNKPSSKAKTPSAPEPVSKREPQTRELTLREKYHISSMPEPVLALISSILEDGAALTSEDYESSPVAAAAAGLFSLPTLTLAMFRAVSPYYYSLDVGGSMYLYNDAMYLAEKLSGFAATWKARDDLSPRARTMLRLDAEITKLQGFASRAYSREMAVQKTVLRDLLGGDQNVLAQSRGGGGGPRDDEEAEDYVDAAVVRVRSMAAAWEGILAPSAWHQAVGSLADAVAVKLIGDVLDMSSISEDEAFSLASLIAKVTELDDLFKGDSSEPSSHAEAESVPTTSQYAPSWLRLQYLSEVLQSNLREVRYLWMESELSLYFSVEEVLDLIRLSFEDNAKVREVVREIKQHPHPVMVD